MIRVELPWPAKPLHPNFRSRSHWPKTRALKRARHDAQWAALEALSREGYATRGQPSYAVQTTFHPPGGYHYDADNLVASCKAFFDGIADALETDDNLFRHGAPVIAEPVKHGRVVIVLS